MKPKPPSGTLRVVPLWIIHKVKPGYERVWSELNSLQTYGSKKSAFPTIAHLARATALSRKTVERALAQLRDEGALSWERPGGRSNHYVTYADDPSLGVRQIDVAGDGDASDRRMRDVKLTHETRQIDVPVRVSTASEPQQRILSPEVEQLNGFRAIVLGEWSTLYHEKTGTKFLIVGRAVADAGRVAQLAIESHWDAHRLTKFLHDGIDYLLADNYWSSRVSLGGILSQANEIVAAGASSTKVPGLVDYGEVRRELDEIANEGRG